MVDITPNKMQARILEDVFDDEDRCYKRIFVMAGCRSGKTTLLNLICKRHIEGYHGQKPNILFVTPVKYSTTYKSDFHELFDYINYTSPKSKLNLKGTPRREYTMVVIDAIEIVQAMFGKNGKQEFLDYMKLLSTLSGGIIVISGLRSDYFVHLYLKYMNDLDTYKAVYDTWDATNLLKKETIKEEFKFSPNRIVDFEVTHF